MKKQREWKAYGLYSPWMAAIDPYCCAWQARDVRKAAEREYKTYMHEPSWRKLREQGFRVVRVTFRLTQPRRAK